MFTFQLCCESIRFDPIEIHQIDNKLKKTLGLIDKELHTLGIVLEIVILE